MHQAKGSLIFESPVRHGFAVSDSQGPSCKNRGYGLSLMHMGGSPRNDEFNMPGRPHETLRPIPGPVNVSSGISLIFSASAEGTLFQLVSPLRRLLQRVSSGMFVTGFFRRDFFFLV